MSSGEIPLKAKRMKLVSGPSPKCSPVQNDTPVSRKVARVNAPASRRPGRRRKGMIFLSGVFV